MEPYVGEILPVAFNFAPRGWHICDGSLLQINQYQALFSLLGTQFGGNGVTTFGLPDLRGRAAVGFGQGTGLSPYTMGQMGGNEFVVVTTQTMPAHTHTANLPASTNIGTMGVPGPTAYPSAAADQNTGASYNQFTAPDTSSKQPGALANNGGSQGHENRQPLLTINYIIALQGVFPSRN